MAAFTPYTYIQCPCFEASERNHSSDAHGSGSASPSGAHDLPDDDDDGTFDPRSPRSNYSLYPLEYLLYCVDCHQIRCPRCVSEELVTVYCPSCLFEVASSSVKTEGNRCTRSCFQCPICIGPLAVQSLEAAPEPSALLTPEAAAPPAPLGPWALTCSYCNWSSSEIDLTFEKPQGIFAQLSRLRNGDSTIPEASVASGDTTPTKREADPAQASTKARFAAMKSFYQSQLADANPSSGVPGGMTDFGYGSPAALTRIMSLYAGNTLKPKNKATAMREADTPSEGLRVTDLNETPAVSELRRVGYDETVTRAQAAAQVEEGAHFARQLWPIPSLLRTKRAKRCPACRHILSKPEAKVTNTRWRIRLVAGSHIPSITIKPLLAPGAVPAPLLTPLKPTQYLLTFKNPMFEDIKVTLATPATTPGRFASRVTVLCPQFTIEANSDDYDLNEVLKADDTDRDDGRPNNDDDDGTPQVEAGKVFERGRNWVSIVVEVIPALVKVEPKPSLLLKPGEVDDLSPLKEDEDVLEIPMFVRLEWESEASQDQVGAAASKEKDAKEKRELAYWCALGIGRISQD